METKMPVPRTKVLLRSEESGGAVSLIENVVPPGFPGPYPHTHGFDEAFYVLEGELTFQVEDELLTASPGELAFGVEPPPWALQPTPPVTRVGPRIGEM
jgi:quercetin dioxygenase-like cupin family protein